MAKVKSQQKAIFIFSFFFLFLIFLLIALGLFLQKPIKPRPSPSKINPYTNKTIFSIDKEIKFFIPPNAYSKAIRFEVTEVPFSPNIDGYKGFRGIALHAYIRNEQPLFVLNEEVLIEYSNIPETTVSYSEKENVTRIYEISSPKAFIYSTEKGWLQVPLSWNSQKRKITVRTRQIGSFAFVVPETALIEELVGNKLPLPGAKD